MKHLMNNSVTIYGEDTKDEFGKQSWQTGETTDGRFIEENKIVYDEKGEKITTDASLYLQSDETIALGNKVVYDSTDYQVIKIEKPKQVKNVHHIKVYLRLYE